MKQLASLSVFGFVFCFFYSEARSCHGACFYEVTVRVPTVLSLRSPLKVLIALFHQKPSFMWKPGDVVSPGIQREIALSDSGGAAQLPSGSIFRSTVYCNLYLRRVRTWLSDWGNFIFD